MNISSEQTKKALVLIVDDQLENVVLLQKYLRKSGYVVEGVRSSDEALAFLAKQTPDIILLDMCLAGESGLELCKKIRANAQLADLPLLLFSGYDQSEDRISGLTLGARDFISKSSDLREIVARVELHLHLAEKQRQLTQKNRELSALTEQLRSTQEQVIQAEKHAVLGRLSAGVAHELSTPMGFIISNIKGLKTGIADLYQVLDAEEELIGLCARSAAPALIDEKIAAIGKLRTALQVSAMRREFESMCTDCLDGIELLARIAGDLREFSRDDRQEFVASDLNCLVDQALRLVRVETGDRVKIERVYAELPQVMCMPSRIVQMFLILIMNALQAMTGAGQLTLRTTGLAGKVKVDVSDTGVGISAENLGRIFDPFFTTKPAEQGTGLGLAIAQKIATFHGGVITVASQVGRGTVATVELPCGHPADPERAV